MTFPAPYCGPEYQDAVAKESYKLSPHVVTSSDTFQKKVSSKRRQQKRMINEGQEPIYLSIPRNTLGRRCQHDRCLLVSPMTSYPWFNVERNIEVSNVHSNDRSRDCIKVVYRRNGCNARNFIRDDRSLTSAEGERLWSGLMNILRVTPKCTIISVMCEAAFDADSPSIASRATRLGAYRRAAKAEVEVRTNIGDDEAEGYQIRYLIRCRGDEAVGDVGVGGGGARDDRDGGGGGGVGGEVMSACHDTSVPYVGSDEGSTSGGRREETNDAPNDAATTTMAQRAGRAVARRERRGDVKCMKGMRGGTERGDGKGGVVVDGRGRGDDGKKSREPRGGDEETLLLCVGGSERVNDSDGGYNGGRGDGSRGGSGALTALFARKCGREAAAAAALDVLGGKRGERRLSRGGSVINGDRILSQPHGTLLGSHSPPGSATDITTTGEEVGEARKGRVSCAPPIGSGRRRLAVHRLDRSVVRRGGRRLAAADGGWAPSSDGGLARCGRGVRSGGVMSGGSGVITTVAAGSETSNETMIRPVPTASAAKAFFADIRKNDTS